MPALSCALPFILQGADAIFEEHCSVAIQKKEDIKLEFVPAVNDFICTFT